MHTTDNHLREPVNKEYGAGNGTLTKEPSKILTDEGYHLSSARCRISGCSNNVQAAPVGSSQGSMILIPMRPSAAKGLLDLWPPTLTYCNIIITAAIKFQRVAHHRPVAQKPSCGTETVGNEFDGGSNICVQVPECCPGGVILDLQKGICSPVKENGQVIRDDHGFKCYDTRGAVLHEVPALASSGCGCSRAGSEEEWK